MKLLAEKVTNSCAAAAVNNSLHHTYLSLRSDRNISFLDHREQAVQTNKQKTNLLSSANKNSAKLRETLTSKNKNQQLPIIIKINYQNMTIV